jgi:hypothetical protein
MNNHTLEAFRDVAAYDLDRLTRGEAEQLNRYALSLQAQVRLSAMLMRAILHLYFLPVVSPSFLSSVVVSLSVYYCYY